MGTRDSKTWGPEPLTLFNYPFRLVVHYRGGTYPSKINNILGNLQNSFGWCGSDGTSHATAYFPNKKDAVSKVKKLLGGRVFKIELIDNKTQVVLQEWKL